MSVEFYLMSIQNIPKIVLGMISIDIIPSLPVSHIPIIQKRTINVDTITDVAEILLYNKA